VICRSRASSAEKDGFDNMWHAQRMRLIEDTTAALDAATEAGS
jgi:hypothetical protein